MSFRPTRFPGEPVPQRFTKWQLIADQVIRAAQSASLSNRIQWLLYACSMLDEQEREAMALDKPLTAGRTPLELLEEGYVTTIDQQGMLEELLELRNHPRQNWLIYSTDDDGRNRQITSASPKFKEIIRSQLEHRTSINKLLGFIVEKLARYAEGQGVRVSVPASILGPDGRPIARTILTGDSVQFPAEDQQKPQQDKKPHEDK